MAATIELPESADCPVLDDSRLTVLRDVEGDDGRPFVFEFVELFETDCEQRLQQLREVITAGDVSDLRKLAHTLKGSCRNVGAMAMATACLHLEKAGDTCTAEEAMDLLGGIEEEYGRVKERIPEVLQ